MANILRDAGRPGAAPQGRSDQLPSAQTRRPFQRGATTKLDYDFSGSLDPKRSEFVTVKGKPIYYKTAKGIIMSDKIKGPANELARDFFSRTGASLTITSGRRDALRQARAMYKKFQANVRKDYAGRPLGDEIIGVYDHAAARRYNEQQTITAMAHAIQNQVDRGLYVSHHLRDNAVDIQWQANEPYRNALADIAREHGYILKNEGYPQHHHLTFTNRQ